MGIYLNPGYKSFEEAYNSRIFVDKTEMILHINSVVRTKQKYVAVSRPRRFGKSYAVDMLCAYFGQVQDEQPEGENSVSLRDDLFHKCKLSGHKGWDKYLGSFDVIRPVVESKTTGVIKNYWNKTESYEALADFIKMDYDGLKDAVALLMDGGRLAIDTSTYQNDMTTFTGRDDVLSLLVHLGYLGFDDETNEVFIPNKEILEEFRTSTKTGG